MKLTKVNWKDMAIGQDFILVWKDIKDIDFGVSQIGIGVELNTKIGDSAYARGSLRILVFPEQDFDTYITDNKSYKIYEQVISIMKDSRDNQATKSGTEVLETIQEFTTLLLPYRKGN